MKIQIPSLRVALAAKMTDEDNHRLCLQELEALDEKLLQAQQHIELYQARISKAFNKKVKERIFRREVWSYLSDDLRSCHISPKEIPTQMGMAVYSRGSLLK